VGLQGRDIVSITDLTKSELIALFDLADEMRTNMVDFRDLAVGKIVAALFFEPSTRTRLSFETAAHRIGAEVITVTEARSSSMAKGETLADTTRIISSYVDLIIARHALEGSARVLADYSTMPFINAGDGGHEHPTQTLTDLYAMRKMLGKIEGITIGLCGDLKHGRTVHSLAKAMALFNATIICISPSSLTMPENVLRDLAEDYDCRPLEIEAPEKVIKDLDVLYMTRVQRERFESEEEYEAVKGSYVLDKDLLSKAKKKMIVLHPLPRVDEIAYEVDEDRRAAYFGQAALGVPVRMALLAALMGARDIEVAEETPPWRKEHRRITSKTPCGNPRCVTTTEKYLPWEFEVICEEPLRLRCVYCDTEREE